MISPAIESPLSPIFSKESRHFWNWVRSGGIDPPGGPPLLFSRAWPLAKRTEPLFDRCPQPVDVRPAVAAEFPSYPAVSFVIPNPVLVENPRQVRMNLPVPSRHWSGNQNRLTALKSLSEGAERPAFDK